MFLDIINPYSYDFVYWNKESVEVNVGGASAVRASSRQGITFQTVLHALAREPSRAAVIEIKKEGENVRVKYVLDRAAKVEVANGLGVRGLYKSYSLHYASKGSVLIDPKRHVPIRANDRPDWEVRFLDYAPLGEGLYAPTHIQSRKKDQCSDWRFRLYAPGLWLFRRGSSRQGVLGMLVRHAKVYVRNVRVNGEAVSR